MMNASRSMPARSAHGFSLIETVIAIGVVAVLLSGFLIVFAPAAKGIKDSINSKSAARLVNTLEQELVSLRGNAQSTEFATGFDKAFEYIKESSESDPDNALLVYKYRASLNNNRASDGTPEPVNSVENQIPGEDYVVRNMMRRKGDPEFVLDIPAIEGPVYVVKCIQLVRDAGGELTSGTPGQIFNADDPLTAADESTTQAATAAEYNRAVIAFVADFYSLPSRGFAFFDTQFESLYPKLSRPAFSRNLAVRR